jgi:hypothetical protein
MHKKQPSQPRSADVPTPTRNKRPNTKRTGEFSEAAFLLKATSLGFAVTKPWGDSERYDFILDAGSRLWRVQIKGTASIRARGYDVQSTYGIYGNREEGKRKACYTAEDIDILVAYIIPCDAWYLIPVAALAPGQCLRFYPDGGCKRARFEHYREAWHLLRTKKRIVKKLITKKPIAKKPIAKKPTPHHIVIPSAGRAALAR